MLKSVIITADLETFRLQQLINLITNLQTRETTAINNTINDAVVPLVP